MKKTAMTVMILITVVLMGVGMLAGCTSSPTQSAASQAASQSNSTQASSAANEKPYTVRAMMFGDASTENTNEVAAAISKIALEKINCNVEITRIGFGSYSDQLRLALSSNEKLDVFCTLGHSTNELSENGQIVAMNPYLDTVAQDIKAGIPAEDFKCLSVGDQIYGFPSVKEKATNYGYMMLKSVADELGIKDGDIKDYTSLEDAMVKAKALYPDMYPIGMDFNNVYMPVPVDNLDGGLAVLEDAFSDSTQVVNWYQTDSYVNFVKNMYKWAQMGLVQPDAANNSESRLSLMQAGKVLGGFMGFNPGNVEGFAAALGKDLAIFPLCQPFSVTGHVSGIAWCVANNSDNPEKAMAFLNLAYTDKDVSNLLINGIEGKNYDIIDTAKGVIDYPAGVDASTTTYTRLQWAWPNAAITYNWNGEREDQWEYLTNYNNNARQSVAKGFKFDSQNVVNELAACSNVVQKYDVALQCGVLNPDEALPVFYKELDDAGINTVIAEKQKQLDAWLAANN